MSKHHRVVPYLKVSSGVDAIKFYEEAFDADEVSRMMADDGKRVLHCELELNDGTIMLSDEFPEYGNQGGTGSPVNLKGTSTTIHLDYKKPKQVDAAMEQAKAAGAEVIMPAQDVFWGARYGQVRDPFGHVWAFHAMLKKKDREKHEDAKQG
jgi:PhnB protein